jgi:hypothetical protein
MCTGCVCNDRIKAFICKLKNKPNTIYSAVDASLSTKEQLQATAAVPIYWQKELIK